MFQQFDISFFVETRLDYRLVLVKCLKRTYQRKFLSLFFLYKRLFLLKFIYKIQFAIFLFLSLLLQFNLQFIQITTTYHDMAK